MKDRLSYRQLYDELEALNASVFDSLLNEDFEELQHTIDEFTESGIMEQEEFATAREAYRYSSMPFTFDGIWISVDSRNPLDRVVMDVAGPSIQEIHERDVMPVYAYMVEHTEPQEINHEDSKIAGKRCAALQHYKDLYTDLYKDPSSQGSLWNNPLVADAEKHQMVYINRITELAAARSKFYATYDFTSLPLNGMKIIDNEKLRNLDPAQKIKYLTGTLNNIYGNTKNKIHCTDYFSFDGYEKILASNYLQGKGIDRKNWKRYIKGDLPAKFDFYLQLSFYLTIPSSDEIEKFMNLHGYSIKSPMLLFCDILGGNHILYRDLCRWIDAGIDYNLINEMCGLQLEQKEIRKKSH
ncbi:hypothetical protein D7V90_22640 [bacterium 1xD42-87]|nr:hypothetical protein D7V90_22640 [bacterium 1xD42-87]